MLLLSASCLLAIVPSVLSSKTLPPTSGPFSVLHNSFALNDVSRIDKLDPNNGTRKIMLSSFYPVPKALCKKTCTFPYVSAAMETYIDPIGVPLGVAGGQFKEIRQPACCSTRRGGKGDAAYTDASDVPLVLLMHGLGGTRLLHNALAAELASAGYAVVTLDHPYESLAVEFPDGTVIPGLNDPSWYTEEALAPLQEIRIADAQFAVAQLARKDVACKVVPGATSGFNTSRVAAMGHSFGGSVSVNLLMRDDPRFAGALDLDGTVWGENLRDTDKPAVLFGSNARSPPGPHNSTNDATWSAALAHLTGWKSEVGLTGVLHQGFFDLGYLNGTGALHIGKEVADGLLGPLDGKRSFKVLATYTTAFLDFVLKGKKTTLFDEPNKEFPEVIVLKDGELSED